MHILSTRTGGLAVVTLAALALTSLLAAACGGDDDNTTPTKAATTAAASVSAATTAASSTAATSPTSATIPANIGKDDKAQLTGAGATFPAPVYQAWFDDYNHGVAKGVQVNYQPVGSGGGINQFTAKTVDFGASDAAMSDDELAKAPDAQHVPTVIGAITVAYNLSGLSKPLQLDGPAIAGIYLGTIKTWDDPAIKALNPDAKLPSSGIVVVYRSDSSGTSYNFTDYLSKVSPDWKSKVGTTKAPNWPVGQGGKGNDGVTNVVKQTPNAIGYVELQYARANNVAFADVKNKAGKFVTPSVDSASASAAGVTLPDDYRTTITDASGDGAYPITAMTYLLVYKSAGKCSQQQPLVDFLWWAYHDQSAQKTVKDLSYAPLPAQVLPKVEATLKSLKCDDGSKPSLKST